MKNREVLLSIVFVLTGWVTSSAQDCTPVTDCNLNSQEDSCDISQGLSGDCDLNGIPDECQMADSLLADCNMNGLLDACEPVLAAATSGTATVMALMEGDTLFMADPGATRSIEVYRRLGTTWISDGTLAPSDDDPDDGFGSSMAMSGSTAAIGAPNKNGNIGAVYVFERQELGWVQTQLLEPEVAALDDLYGSSVDVHGSTIAVGAPQSPPEEDVVVDGGGFTPGGYVEVWSHDGTAFERTSNITNTDPLNGGGEEVGSALQLTDNNWLMIGSPSDGPPGGSGRVYGYRLNGTEWELTAEISTTDSPTGAAFGSKLSWNGGTLAVTSQRTLAANPDDPMVGAVYTFENSADGSSWIQTDRLISSAAESLDYGVSVQLSGDMLVVGEPKIDSSQGFVHLYNRMEDSTWALVDLIRPIGTVNGDSVGTAVATNGEWIAYTADGVFARVDHREIVPDCNANGADDRCEIRSEVVPDCNGNIIPDSCDIADGTELDCDLDGVPDACFLANGGPDCNANGVPDSCDIASLQSNDCNANGIPDECEPDCDLNGTPDECDLASGAPDCNTNGTLDSCDIASGTSVDCDLNTIPDSCDLANGAADCDTDLVPDSCQIAANPALDCDVNGAIDSCEILANAGLDCNGNSQIDSCDIADLISADCNGNIIPDSCDIADGTELDCDLDGVPDVCFLANGGPDCNVNGVPDSCDIASLQSNDCNGNTIPDSCDIADGTELDCDLDGVPDACFLANGGPDCNANGVPDSCDIASLQSNDCNANGIPDECEPDCDLNGTPDECDLASGAPDCNTNGTLDSCDIASGTSVDCDLNTIPDSCDLANGAADCDTDLVPDSCQIAANPALDCDVNGAIDSCEILANAGLDCNGNSQIDSCDIADLISADCDLNGTPDECQIESGFSIDCNSNGIPDECEDPFLENTPPTFLGTVPNISLDSEAGLCTAAASWTDPAVTDNCTAAPALTSSHMNGSQFPVGTTTVTLTATDDHGNSSDTSFTVTVTDVEDPTITNVPATIEVNNDPDLCGAAVSWTEPTIADNCTVDSSGSDFAIGSTFAVGTHSVTYTATDSAGRSTSASFSIVVTDAQPPAFTSTPMSMTLDNDLDACGALAMWDPAATSDNCEVLSTSSTHSSGDFFPTGDTTVTITTTDTAGLSAQHSFTVTVNDAQAPALSQMPQSMTLSAEAGLCEASVPWDPPLTSDNCPGELLEGSHMPGSAFAVGAHTVTYTVTDTSGNPTSASFDILIEDGEAPQFDQAPMTMTLQSDLGLCDTTAEWAMVATSDNCDVLSLTSTHQSGDTFPVGTTTVSMTLEDIHGNLASHSFDVIVEDNELPLISGMPTPIAQSNDTGVCGATISWADPSASDNCSLSEFTSSHANGSLFNVGTTTVTYTASDIHGNTSSSSFDIVISDDELPTISSLSGNLTSTNDLGACGAIMVWSEPRPDDNCEIQSFTSTHQSGEQFPVGTTTVTYTATDIYGNELSGSFDVSVSDDEVPTIGGDLGNLEVSTDPDLCSSLVSWPEPEALDNCPGASLSSTIANGSTFDLGDTLVTYTVVDAAGNSSETSFTVMVLDQQDPSFDSAPENVSLSSDPGLCSATHSWEAPQTSDNCDGLTMNTSHPSGTAFDVGSTDVTMFLTDGSGNTVQHTFSVAVLDNEDPQLSGVPTDITQTNDLGVCGASIDWALPEGSDNCSLGDLAASHQPGDTFGTGTTVVSYSLADGSGNVVTASFTVTVTDDDAPIIATSGDISIEAPAGNCSAFVTIPEATGTDNCQLVNLTNDRNAGVNASGTYDYGTTIITWTATDSSGNTSTAEQSVTVTVDMTDCNSNGTPDVCEIVDGSAPDCNGNGVPDSCDLASGAAEDCNNSGLPDSCEVASGSVSDCDGNGTPDECDTDCDGNGSPDACDIASGAAEDCNGNEVPDSCDLSSGTSVDTNGNSTPDECEPSFRRGDANEDGGVDIADAIFMLYTLMLNGPASGCADTTDSNDSGTHDIADAVFILSYQFAGGNAPPSPGPNTCGVDATPDDGLSCDSYNACP